MSYNKTLESLKEQIERDLKVSTAPEDNEYHLAGLEAVEALLEYLS